LAEVAAEVTAGGDWSIALPEYLDTFYYALRGFAGPSPQSCLDAEPAPLDDPIRHVMLGAIAEYLAERWYLSAPHWTRDPSRFLKAPHFTAPTEKYKGWYFVQSPVAFRRRMIFTESEPLRRARLPRAEFYPRDLARGYTWSPSALRAVFSDAVPCVPTRARPPQALGPDIVTQPQP
jgi:hypothetical protein